MKCDLPFLSPGKNMTGSMILLTGATGCMVHRLLSALLMRKDQDARTVVST